MTEPSPERYLALKTVLMPRDTNPHGTIFGGVILSYIDQAGAVGARYAIRQAGWPSQPLVTVAMEQVEFHEPVFVGDVVSFYTKTKRCGTTSITMHVTVELERDEALLKVTEAVVSYVSIELGAASRRPVPIRGQ